MGPEARWSDGVLWRKLDGVAAVSAHVGIIVLRPVAIGLWWQRKQWAIEGAVREHTVLPDFLDELDKAARTLPEPQFQPKGRRPMSRPSQQRLQTAVVRPRR